MTYQPPMTASTSYNAGYENNYLQQQGSVMNSNSQWAGASSQVFPNPNTPGLPRIPPPSALQQFGNLSLSATTPVNHYQLPIQNSYSTPNHPQYGQASASQQLGVSAFPPAQGQYNYNPYNTQTPQKQSGCPWWLWLLLCLLLITAISLGVWYYQKYKQTSLINNTLVPPPPPVPSYSSTSQTTTISPSSSIYNLQSSSFNTQTALKQVQSIDQDHHHLRYYIS